jgi:hypothetical protein
LFNHNKGRNYSSQSISNLESLGLEHVRSGNITNLVINTILNNKNVSINKDKFTELLTIQGVELNLAINEDNYKIFVELVVRSFYKGFPGVYIFHQ